MVHSLDNPTCSSAEVGEAVISNEKLLEKCIESAITSSQVLFLSSVLFTIYFTSGKGFDDLHSGCLKENIKLEKCKTGKFKDVTPLGTDKSRSSKENIKIKKCEIENFKEVTPYRTDKSNQSNVINSDTFFTANVPRQQETLLNQNDWESLINEARETKSGKVQLPSRWAYF